jgi:hypothetical protein
MDDEIDFGDSPITDALQALHGADLKSSDRTYLHGRADFEAWLARLRSGRARAHGA